MGSSRKSCSEVMDRGHVIFGGGRAQKYPPSRGNIRDDIGLFGLGSIWA